MQKLENGRSELIPILDLLNRLVSDQKKDLSELNFPPALSSPDVIFGWFLKTDRFKKAYKEALNFSLKPHNYQELQQNGDDFSGRIFEDMAYYVLAWKQAQEGKVVLSPDRTLEFWQRLYPKNSTASFPYGTGTIGGISVPDGMIVTEFGNGHRILTLCEYTLSPNANAAKKRRGLVYDAGFYPNLFGQVSTVFVSTTDGLNGKGVLKMPFSNREFGNFINYIFRGYGDLYEATLSDIQARSQYQFTRVLTRSRNGRLTKEDGDYLDKVTRSPGLI